jgi:hypothetical protein
MSVMKMLVYFRQQGFNRVASSCRNQCSESRLPNQGVVMSIKSLSVFWMLAVLTLAPATMAGTQRYWLAHFEKWSSKQGFSLYLENKSEGATPLQLSRLALASAIGTGKSVRYMSTRPQWQLNQTYTATLVIKPASVTFSLDGKVVKQMQLGMVPSRNPRVTAAYAPSLANRGPRGEYQIIQHALTIESDRQPTQHTSLISPDQLKVDNLWRFEPTGGHATKLAFEPQAGETLTLTASFTILAAPPVDQLPAMIDRYGQAIEAQFPGKVKTDADLVTKWRDEQAKLAKMPPSGDYDRFGGTLKSAWKERGTGFYRTTERNGKFWLITPEGNPCFYLGMCTVPSLTWPATSVEGRENLFADIPPKTGPYKDAWIQKTRKGKKRQGVAFHAANMIRKYGPNWKAIAKQMASRRLASFGFHGIGKWGGTFGDGAAGGGIDSLPVTPVVHWRGVPKLDKLPDVFDPEIAKQCKVALAEQIAPHVNNPLIVGWSIGNEKYGIVWPAEIHAILGKGQSTAAKRALVDYALAKIYNNDVARLAAAWKSKAIGKEGLYADTALKLPAGDFEKVRRFFADAYHAFAYRTTKAIDPNHLFLSYWIIPGWWVNESDWHIAARHCDVLGFDRYSLTFADQRLTDLLNKVDKPVLIGEFNFPADYQGKRGYGSFKVSTPDETTMGNVYAQWVRDAAANRHCVGLLFFHYRDQPLTGRSLSRVNGVVGGEHYAFGLVDITDTPKWTLVEKMREANLNAAEWRLSTPTRK